MGNESSNTLHGQAGNLYIQEDPSKRKNIDGLSLEEAKELVKRYRNARDKLKEGKPDPLYDLIIEESLAKNEYPKE